MRMRGWCVGSGRGCGEGGGKGGCGVGGGKGEGVVRGRVGRGVGVPEVEETVEVRRFGHELKGQSRVCE